MNKFYHKTTFDFSNSAKKWILDRYNDRFDHAFFHDLDITQYAGDCQKEWHDSLPGQELHNFLSTYNCDYSYYGIGVFISNTEILVRGNPHIDAKFSQGNIYKIKSRFNVMVLGEPSDPMVWWDHMTWGDTRLQDYSFTSITGFKYNSKGIPGNTPDERFNFLGEPTDCAINLLTPSAFVRTDCAHTVYTSGQPRLIVTAALDKTLEEILSRN
jgi:hypothetical protein